MVFQHFSALFVDIDNMYAKIVAVDKRANVWWTKHIGINAELADFGNA